MLDSNGMQVRSIHRRSVGAEYFTRGTKSVSQGEVDTLT
jgi:hypothetical protein